MHGLVAPMLQSPWPGSPGGAVLFLMGLPDEPEPPVLLSDLWGESRKGAALVPLAGWPRRAAGFLGALLALAERSAAVLLRERR